MSRLTDILDLNAVLELDQYGHDRCRVDLKGGFVDVLEGPARRLPLQVLGVESLPKTRWSWAWGTRHRLHVPEDSLRLALEIKQWGASEVLPELLDEELSTDRSDMDLPDMLSAIAWSRQGGPRFLCIEEQNNARVHCLALEDATVGSRDLGKHDNGFRLLQMTLARGYGRLVTNTLVRTRIARELRKLPPATCE